MTPFYIIIMERATPEELEAVHEIAKAHAESWWHEVENVWIVKGHRARYWRTLIAPVIPYGNSGVVVLGLPVTDPRAEASNYGVDHRARMAWLYDNIYTRAA